MEEGLSIIAARAGHESIATGPRRFNYSTA
jgi:hypothetical protein